MKRLFFGYTQKEICTKCGSVSFSPSTKDSLLYKPECPDCYDRKVITLKAKRHSKFRLVRGN